MDRGISLAISTIGFVGIGGFLGYLMCMNRLDAHKKIIPDIAQVQKTYIAPSKLELYCADLEGNGELETVLKISGQPYLLREINGKPTLSMYSVEPAKVIPNK